MSDADLKRWLFFDGYHMCESCDHENAMKKHFSNTGNYDPSNDCYWTEFYCPYCGRKWTVDGSV